MAKITNIPNQHATKVIDFPRLDGGLNLWELDYRISRNQSPEMKNLWWQDGVLQCRDGQAYITGESVGTGYTCASELFWDHAFFHVSDKICYMELVTPVGEGETRDMVELCSGVPENRGTFFRYNDWLFYKNRGGFFKIKYDPDASPVFSVVDMTEEAYTPIIAMNSDPSSGAGDLYQPENRLSPKKTIQYNAAETTETVTKTGDGSAKEFDMGKTASADFLTDIDYVYFGSTLISPTLYTLNKDTGKVKFTTAPESGIVITFVLKFGVVSYQLPVKELDAVTKVVVDAEEKVEGTDYAVDLEKGLVVFVTPPPVHNPIVNNTVEITYSKTNEDALNSVLDCPYATVFGGDNNVCIILGGCKAQPNAFFWSGNDSVAMNAGYWPMSYYQLAGDSEDGITGFGRQYSTMIVFKERSIGKAGYGIENVDGRDSISFTYANINSKIGCDLPWTIQLVENNMVFCNSQGGVHVVRDSSSALENNIECISRNVNGTSQRPGLLEAVREAGKDLTCSFDDDNRYWVCANGQVYLWDYLLSSFKDPSWFYFTEVNGIAYLRNVDKSYHLNSEGHLTLFKRDFMDYGGAIEKVYQFPPQFFDTYDRLKDILYCIFTVRSDTDSRAQIQYQSDYEIRYDQTDIRSLSWKLVPRNLLYRNLSVQRFAHVARRKPGCRHVRHFSMRLENNEIAQDLSIISAQIYFRYLGRDR